MQKTCFMEQWVLDIGEQKQKHFKIIRVETESNGKWDEGNSENIQGMKKITVYFEFCGQLGSVSAQGENEGQAVDRVIEELYRAVESIALRMVRNETINLIDV